MYPRATDFSLTALSRLQADLHEVLDLRDAIISSGMNMYQPTDLLKRVKALGGNDSVNKALMMLLSHEVGG